jgi:hypothetical protein
MRGGLLLIALLGCSHPASTGPAWPKTHAHDTDGGESLAPRAAARAIAAAVEEDRPADRAAGDKAAATPAAAVPAAAGDKPAVTPSVTVTEEPLTAEEMVIEVDDTP